MQKKLKLKEVKITSKEVTLDKQSQQTAKGGYISLGNGRRNFTIQETRSHENPLKLSALDKINPFKR